MQTRSHFSSGLFCRKSNTTMISDPVGVDPVPDPTLEKNRIQIRPSIYTGLGSDKKRSGSDPRKVYINLKANVINVLIPYYNFGQ